MSLRIITIEEEATGTTRLLLYRQGAARKLLFSADYTKPDDPTAGREMADALADLLRETGVTVTRKDYIEGIAPTPAEVQP